MKKFYALVAAFLMMFLISCGDGGSTTENNVNDETAKNDDSQDAVDDVSSVDTENEDADTINDTEKNDATDVDIISPTPDDQISDSDSDSDSDTVSKPVACSHENDTRLGTTSCNEGKGTLYQTCEDGFWVDTEECFTCNPGNYPNVCGDYAQKMWFTASSKVATINMAEAWTRTYFHIVQEQDGNLIHIKAKICNIKIDNTKSYLLEMQMPQSFADALPTLPKESTLVDNSDGTYGFTQDTFWEIRSIDPNCYGDNPGDYALPSDSTNSCVQDWDNDGIPGLYVKTAGTMSGYVHIVEKSSSAFTNSWFAADGQTAGGDVIWTDEQEVLEASSATLKMGAENQMKATSDEFEGSANFYEQFKIPDGSDCAYVVDNAATIFNADPVDIDN